MLFPYTSAYMHLFRRNGMRSPLDPPDSYGMRPWDDGANTDTDTYPGTGSDTGQRGFHGFGSDEQDRTSRRRALSSGLLGLGTQLLEAAPRGDYSGGLARGAAAFSEGYMGSRDRDRQMSREEVEEARRRAQDARAAEQERDRNESHDIDVRRANSEFDTWKEQQERGRQTRARTGKSAEQMVAEIESLAASRPNDGKLQAMSKRAAGYALGEDSDLNKLAELHESVTNQAYLDEDYDRATRAGVRRSREEIAAGVAADPKAAERRANEQLAISRGHLAVDQQRNTREASRPTPNQTYAALEKRAAEKLEAKVQAWQTEQKKLPIYTDYEAKDIHPPAGLIEQWRKEAIREAMVEYQSSMDTILDYTATGELVPR